MALLYNEKSPIRIKYNGNEVRKVNYGETTVWRLLPEGYTEVDYIEGTGTQYIDTGVQMTTSDDVNMIIQLTSDTTVQNFYGSRNTTSLNDGSWNLFYNVGGSSGSMRFRLDWNSNPPRYSSLISLDTDVNIRLYSSSGYGEIVVDGTSYTGVATKTNAEYNTVLFGCNSGGTIVCNPLRIKKYSVKRNGSLIQDLVPAIRNSDNEPGMYDLVSKTFFTNSGSGTFTTGDPV